MGGHANEIRVLHRLVGAVGLVGLQRRDPARQSDTESDLVRRRRHDALRRRGRQRRRDRLGGPGQKYGAWEVRVKIPPAGAPNYDPPVLLLWPDAEKNWPTGGEIDFMEIWGGDGSRQAVNSVLHYSSTNQQAGATMKVDATQWHTYAVKWTPTEITTYVDGTPIFTTNDTSMFPPGPMHLAIQLDMLGPDISAGAQMQVAWVKEYSLASIA